MNKFLKITFINLSFLIIFSFISASKAHAVWQWEQLIDDGFGRTAPFGSEDFFDMYTWNDCIYAGIEGNSGTEGALVYRSCDGETFTLVSPVGFDEPLENDHVDSIHSFNGYIYVSTAVASSAYNGFKLWRSPTGDIGSWVEVISDGAGTNFNENLKDLVVFNGELCGGTWNTQGAQVLCSPDGLTFRQVNTNGFGDTDNDIAWRNVIFKDYLYVSVQNTVTGGEVWRSKDLSNWEQVIDNGYGAGTGEAYLRTPFEYKGYLYIWFRDSNEAVSQLLRSSNGTDYEVAATFPSTTDGSVANEVEYNSAIYVSLYDFTQGTIIYRTQDGINWEQLSNPGLDGNINNSFALPTIWRDYLYLGVENTVTGQQVWRSQIIPYPTPIPTVEPKAPSCRSEKPTQKVELFQVDTSDTSATLYITPASDDIDSYAVYYGMLNYNQPHYGTVIPAQPSSGVQKLTINDLYPNEPYYFMVQPVNNCAAGDISNRLEATTMEAKSSYYRRIYLYSTIIDVIKSLKL